MSLWLVLIIAFIVGLNGGYLALQIWLLKRHDLASRGTVIAVWTWTLAMNGLFLLQALAPEAWTGFLRRWFYFPLAVQMVWNVLFILLLVPLLLLAVLLVRWRKRLQRNPAVPVGTDLSRRKFIYLLSYGAVPATALGMGVHGTLSQDDLRVNAMSVPVSNLPPQWEGFTIAHVSDIHSGVFCGPERMRRIGDRINDMKADLIVLTGDLINHSMSEFPDVLDLVHRLESRQGLWICEGNHDHPATGDVVRACGENNLRMLYNSSATLSREGARLVLAGLPWIPSGIDLPTGEVTRLFPERQSGDLRLLLAHHPRLFDSAESADLVLSGHTHGGQIMFGSMGLGPMFFKYWSGLYRRGTSSLVVSNGCGDWFPCRIGAPAEVGLLRLTRAAS